jgi:peptidoglycan hydrolase-like protein with peptidoglycan-binding domain
LNLRKWQAFLLGMLLTAASSGQAQAKQTIHWVVRNYYTSENAEEVEIWLYLGEARDLEFISFDRGTANEVPNSNHRIVDTWWSGHGHRYQTVIKDGTLKVLQQDIATSESSSSQFVVSRDLVEVKRISVTAEDLSFGPIQSETAKEGFSRTLSLQRPRLHGSDVWILQRFLVEQELLEPGDIDGWFGPDTENAVKRFQSGHQLPNDGIVGPMTWNALAGPDAPAEGD